MSQSVKTTSAKASRRDVALLMTPVALLPTIEDLVTPLEVHASILNDTWQAMGGGPPDLFFPDDFLGTWTVCASK